LEDIPRYVAPPYTVLLACCLSFLMSPASHALQVGTLFPAALRQEAAVLNADNAASVASIAAELASWLTWSLETAVTVAT
jgi:hypothetical protein